MGHWADEYVGLPAEEPHPCWLLVRRVLIDMTGLAFPAFDSLPATADIVARETAGCIIVQEGEERPLDIAIMNTEVRRGMGWAWLPAHMGIVVGKGQVLHVHRGGSARIDDLRRLDVVRLLRLRELA